MRRSAQRPCTRHLCKICTKKVGNKFDNKPVKPMGEVQREAQAQDFRDPNARSTRAASDQSDSLGPIAAMMLMTIMYSGRVARYDLPKVMSFLAKRITKWDHDCDRRLHRLMCYLKKTRGDVMAGFVGDNPADLTAHLFVDADFAGCPYTLKSSNGCHFDIQGPNSKVPIAGSCNGQTATAQSSTEAELASLSSGMKNRGDPAIVLLTVLITPISSGPLSSGPRFHTPAPP